MDIIDNMVNDLNNENINTCKKMFEEIIWNLNRQQDVINVNKLHDFLKKMQNDIRYK